MKNSNFQTIILVAQNILQNESLLSLAAEDHCKYMADKNKLTHFQRNKYKKTPKNEKTKLK